MKFGNMRKLGHEKNGYICGYKIGTRGHDEEIMTWGHEEMWTWGDQDISGNTV